MIKGVTLGIVCVVGKDSDVMGVGKDSSAWYMIESHIISWHDM